MFPFEIFNKYPYTNFHNENQDWIINTIKEYTDKVDQLEQNLREIVSEFIDADLVEFKAEVNSEIDARFAEITADIDTDLNAMRADINAFKLNTDNSINQLRNDVTAELRAIENEVTQFEASINSDMHDLQTHMSELAEEVQLIGEDLDERFNVLAVQLITEMQEKIDELIASIPDLTTIYVIDPVTKKQVHVQESLDNIYRNYNDIIVRSADAFTIAEYLSLGLTIRQCLSYRYSISDWLFRAKRRIVNELPADKAKPFINQGFIERNLRYGHYCYPIENILINHFLCNVGALTCQDMTDLSLTCEELTRMSIDTYNFHANRAIFEMRNV